VDIHKSDIDDLKQRVSKRNYRKYTLEMRLARVRALKDQKIRFEFPVTALIGTNGGGKSTVLGAAALAYKSVKPGDFFPKSNVGDTSMQNWRIDYELVDRDKEQAANINRNARFVAAKWRREELVDRQVIYFPIKRTVPAGEQPRYKRFIGISNYENPDVQPLEESVIKAAGRILGRDLSKYRVARIKSGDLDYILLGERKDDDYSQFHFGAGEASIIEIVQKIEQASDDSLILIEEIENGLHPIATQKLSEYLVDVAKRKRVQVIFTTHSEHALKPLPPEAKWAAIDGQLYQGDLNIESLRAITGVVSKDGVIFVEDVFAKDWVDDILRQYCPKQLQTLEVHAAGGYPFVAEVTRHHNLNPAIKTKALAIIDGDAPVVGELPVNVIRLPGEVPENVIWKYVETNAETLAGRIQQRCQIPQMDQGKIIAEMKSVTVDAGDPHLLFKRLAEKLGYLSEIVVRRAFISLYNEANKDALRPLIEVIDPSQKSADGAQAQV